MDKGEEEGLRGHEVKLEDGECGSVHPGQINLDVFTFNVKLCCCLISPTVAYILPFVFVPNLPDHQGSAFALGFNGHHLRGLDLCLVVVPHDVYVFAELTV